MSTKHSKKLTVATLGVCPNTFSLAKSAFGLMPEHTLFAFLLCSETLYHYQCAKGSAELSCHFATHAQAMHSVIRRSPASATNWLTQILHEINRLNGS